MFAPEELSTRTRRIAAAAIHRTWAWISAVGSVSPDDARGRRFRSMGPRSCIAFPPGAVFGEGWITIGADTLIGPNVSLSVGMPGERLDPRAPAVIRIGERCNIGRGNSIVARFDVVIEDDVTTGPNVYITDHNHTYAELDVPITAQWPEEDPVLIGAGSWLGAGVTVLPGTTLGRNVVVGAGSVVRGVIPDHAVVAGSPARIVRQRIDGEWVPPIRPQVIRPPEGWRPTHPASP
ncbi:MAG TPA: acyltransferase [Acidimicrobiales bacterium]|nr:acyltransferase [Acidimicrobiales bacterium]